MLRRGEALETGLVLALFETGLGSGPSWQALVLAGWRNPIVKLLWLNLILTLSGCWAWLWLAWAGPSA